MKIKSQTGVVVAILLGGIAVWFALRDPSPPLLNIPAHTSKLPTELAESDIAVASTVQPMPPAVATTAEFGSRAEVLASVRMYMAHAPLRAPAVANPDSPENREILNTMVLKALAGTAATPPTLHRAERAPSHRNE